MLAQPSTATHPVCCPTCALTDLLLSKFEEGIDKVGEITPHLFLHLMHQGWADAWPLEAVLMHTRTDRHTSTHMQYVLRIQLRGGEYISWITVIYSQVYQCCSAHTLKQDSHGHAHMHITHTQHAHTYVCTHAHNTHTCTHTCTHTHTCMQSGTYYSHRCPSL